MEEPRHRSLSILSNRTNSTWRADVFGPKRLLRGAMVFTGPDSLRMHRQRVLDPSYTGEADRGWTPERSCTSSYIMRAAPGTPHPRPKSAFSDSVGWGAWGPTAEMCSWLNSGHQIKLNTFRQQLEHQATHTFQHAWYPGTDTADRTPSATARSPSARYQARLLNREQQEQTALSNSQSSLVTATA